MIPASGAGGPGFNSRNSPLSARCSARCGCMPSPLVAPMGFHAHTYTHIHTHTHTHTHALTHGLKLRATRPSSDPAFAPRGVKQRRAGRRSTPSLSRRRVVMSYRQCVSGSAISLILPAPRVAEKVQYGEVHLGSKPAIAQLVEHLTVECCSNQMVPGSIPGGRTHCRAIGVGARWSREDGPPRRSL
jgi:hypothetical protein